MSAKYQILFVCSGNSCRSPMAEGLLKKRLFPEFIDRVEIKSAGTLGLIDLPPTPLAIQVCEEKGVDISSHLSQSLTKELLEQSDLVLVMADHHKEFIGSNYPEQIDKVHLLTEFDASNSQNKEKPTSIPDPIGMNLDFYRKVVNQIDAELTRILPTLKSLIEKKNSERTGND